MNREQLNRLHYQQAVRFAEDYADVDKQELLTELEQRHQFEQSQTYNLDSQKNDKKLPLVAVLCVILVAIVIASALYWQTGRYQLVKQELEAFNQFEQQNVEQDSIDRNNRYIENLQNHLRQNPNNGEVWFELGQAYSLNNDFNAALICFTNAQTVLGRTPAILGAMATADYYHNKQHLSEQAKSWIDEALQKDAKKVLAY